MCDWPEDTTLRFLEAYQNEPCIWNSKDPNHKNRQKVQDAWTRLSVIMKKNVKELKHRKEILMATFRRHFRRQQASIRSGGADDIYKPNWFAYDQMESFLGPLYSCTDNVNTEEEVPSQEIPIESPALAEEEKDIESDLEQPSTSQTPKLLIPRRRPATDIADRQMSSAFRQLTNILTKRQKDHHQPPPKEEDDCDLYAKLLAKKLREIPPDDRTLMMYDIDTLFVNRIKDRQMCQTLSSYQSLPYEMQIASPRVKRSSTSQTCYSEPLANTSPEPPI